MEFKSAIFSTLREPLLMNRTSSYEFLTTYFHTSRFSEPPTFLGSYSRLWNENSKAKWTAWFQTKVMSASYAEVWVEEAKDTGNEGNSITSCIYWLACGY